MDFTDPSRIDLGLESRAVTFENPTGDRGAGGRAHGGRKGAPNRFFRNGDRAICSGVLCTNGSFESVLDSLYQANYSKMIAPSWDRLHVLTLAIYVSSIEC